jgi:hypothetical protein
VDAPAAAADGVAQNAGGLGPLAVVVQVGQAHQTGPVLLYGAAVLLQLLQLLLLMLMLMLMPMQVAARVFRV